MRNRAERARGFTSNSPLEGVNGRELTIRKHGSDNFIDCIGTWRDGADVFPDFSTRNRFTILDFIRCSINLIIHSKSRNHCMLSIVK